MSKNAQCLCGSEYNGNNVEWHSGENEFACSGNRKSSQGQAQGRLLEESSKQLNIDAIFLNCPIFANWPFHILMLRFSVAD